MLSILKMKAVDHILKVGRSWGGLNSRKAFHEERLAYLLNEVSELRQQVRMLLSESPSLDAWMKQTRSSFDTQWDMLPEGAHLVTDENFVRDATKWIEAYTSLPASWFKGKIVLDAGCGNGRWAFALSALGAEVTAVDQSEHGLQNVRKLCKNFPDFRAQAANLLEPLPLEGGFDLVWSFGVLHHTGDTYRAFQNVQRMVKPAGMIFLMIYGEPTRAGEFAEINTYVKHRQATAAMSFPEKIEYLKRIYPDELVHGYFDAISPLINDLYRFDEFEVWLKNAGFTDVRRTFDNRNLFIVAQRERRSGLS